MTGLLQADGLSMRFGGNAALNDVSLRLDEGARLGLIGPNGSGKTTLLNVLSGVYRATAGSITLNGSELIRRGPATRARKGIVRTFQHPQLAASLTLYENVLAGERVGKLRDRRRRRRRRPRGVAGMELLELFGCLEYANELPDRVPYGQTKLAEVARAAAAEPPVLLLDEPAAGLSGEERTELVAALRQFGERHPRTALCLVEHDVQLVSSLCDQLLVLNAGRQLTTGATADVLRHPEVRTAFLGTGREPGGDLAPEEDA